MVELVRSNSERVEESVSQKGIRYVKSIEIRVPLEVVRWPVGSWSWWYGLLGTVEEKRPP